MVENTQLQDLWQRFEAEFLAPLAHHYNSEDEAEFIKPLRDAIMGVKWELHGFAVEPYSSVYTNSNYRIRWGIFKIYALTLDKVPDAVAEFIRTAPDHWQLPDPEQFRADWAELMKVIE